ncbi:glycosyl transferase [Tianweitania populi]|uniref:Glycosyl transferase n=1 Tax=Tianweitania populi TaxID=1607949 RepID=A0A8J3DYG5_9HYPH|nr:glycosyl transferase [Tianweitania populi]
MKGASQVRQEDDLEPVAIQALKVQASAAECEGSRSPLGRLRLLVALDALLVHGSVGKAAEQMGIGAPAMSRLLQQIRATYGDRILVKTARGMVPTPFAETLRMRLRALATETSDLLDVSQPVEPRTPRAQSNKAPIVAAPPLAMQADLSVNGPTPADFAAKLARIGPRAEPRQRLAKFVATIGAGAGRSRPLTVEEADEAFALILAGKADPIQIGAFLVVLHYRGVTAAELAGLVQASRRHIGAPDIGAGAVDLDWPAYLSPKASYEPWFLLAAKLVAQAGYRVLIHGSAANPTEGERMADSARILRMPIAASLGDASDGIAEQGIAYLPLSAMSQQIQALTALYSLFEMRSPLNIATHLLNPLGAAASLLGASRAMYQTGPRDAAALLGWRDLAVLSNKRDVAEATPYRATKLHRLVDGVAETTLLPSQAEPAALQPIGLTSLEYWQSVWEGRVRDARPRQIVIDTAAAALLMLERGAADAFAAKQEKAAALWDGRLG